MPVFKNVVLKPADFTTTPYTPSVEGIVEMFTGSVVYTSTKTYQVMSDIWETGRYAVVWNFETMRVETVDWVESTTTVDAPPEVMNMAKEYEVYQKARNMIREQKISFEREAERIQKGDTVTVTQGRVGKGTTGKVVVVMNAFYNRGWRSSEELKLGIATSDDRVEVVRNGRIYNNYKDMEWVWARNVKKQNVPAWPGVDFQTVLESARATFRDRMSGCDTYFWRW